MELDHLFFLKKKNCSWTIPFCTVPPTKIMRGLSTFQHPVSMQLVPDCRQTPTISRENLQYASDTLLLSCVAWTVSQQMLVCTLLSCGEYLLQTEMTQKKERKNTSPHCRDNKATAFRSIMRVTSSSAIIFIQSKRGCNQIHFHVNIKSEVI